MGALNLQNGDFPATSCGTASRHLRIYAVQLLPPGLDVQYDGDDGRGKRLIAAKVNALCHLAFGSSTTAIHACLIVFQGRHDAGDIWHVHSALSKLRPSQLAAQSQNAATLQDFAADEVIFREPPLVAAQHTANRQLRVSLSRHQPL